jgi:hypothetical protein
MGMSAKIDDETLRWLMTGPSYVRLRTSSDILGEGRREEEWNEVAADPAVRSLVRQVTAWPWPPLTSHRSAAHPIHKLAFLAELGFRTSDPELGPLAERILSQRSEEGQLCVIMNIPKHFGGSGQDGLAWALCDAPLLAYSLVRMGAGEDGRVAGAISHLLELVRENGWPCAASKSLGSFRGPGRKGDPCPYANLVMLKLLAEVPELSEGAEARIGVETLLGLWHDSHDSHPYMFYMGTDFRKLKAPFVWYDIMHVADVLSRFPWARRDERMRDMASIIDAKADPQGRFTPESVWSDWKGWDFGQKKEPSRWLTLVAYRTLRRLG